MRIWCNETIAVFQAALEYLALCIPSVCDGLAGTHGRQATTKFSRWRVASGYAWVCPNPLTAVGAYSRFLIWTQSHFLLFFCAGSKGAYTNSIMAPPLLQLLPLTASMVPQ